MKKPETYTIFKLKQSIKIDGNWNKPQWQDIRAIEINNYMGYKPYFHPFTRVKMVYDEKNLYGIFQVEDRFVHCINQSYNGPVNEDSCVEFFFSPDNSYPKRYFNLEINCGGIPHMQYHIIPRKKFKDLNVNDIKKIEIAHSLPNLIDYEITEATAWTIEYRIPISMLEKYSDITYPEKGVSWRANFYKIAEKGSNPHYIIWSYIDQFEPDFHLPEFFGILNFQ